MCCLCCLMLHCKLQEISAIAQMPSIGKQPSFLHLHPEGSKQDATAAAHESAANVDPEQMLAASLQAAQQFEVLHSHSLFRVGCHL